MSEHNQLGLAVSSKQVAPDPVLTTLATTTQRQRVLDVAASLKEMRDWLADDLIDLEEALQKAVTDPKADVAWQAADYFLNRAGKRVRPICTLLAARMGGKTMDRAVKEVAISAELVHSATLLHDDVIDQGDERRGQKTARVIYGNAASVLGGDHLLVDALRRVNGVDPLLMAPLIEVIGSMVHAEALQLDLRKGFKPDRRMYLQVVEGKTAALFGWALEAGAYVGGLSKDEIRALKAVGLNLGMTFQLVDDMLDVCGDPKVTGKDASLDLQEGKLTWPTIIAAEKSPELLMRLKSFAGSPVEPTEADRQRLVTDLQATGAVEETRAEAEKYALKAQEKLSHLPKSQARDALAAVVQAALKRSR